MAALTLYHAAPSRSSTTLWMLEEVGEPYEIELISLKGQDQLKPGYRALNPMGKVPTLVNKGAVVSEVAAICCYLADTYPKAGLAPPVGDPMRGPYLKWLFWGPSCFEPAVIDHYLKRALGPRAMMSWIDYESTLDIISAALAKGPYLLGETFSAADVVVGSGVNWGLRFGTVTARPEFAAYAERLRARPAMQRQMARDAELSKPA